MKIFRKKNGARKIQLIRQRNANENGLACVAMLVNYYGPSVSIADIQKAHPEIASDANLRQIIETLSFYKISTTAYRARTLSAHSRPKACPALSAITGPFMSKYRCQNPKSGSCHAL